MLCKLSGSNDTLIHKRGREIITLLCKASLKSLFQQNIYVMIQFVSLLLHQQCICECVHGNKWNRQHHLWKRNKPMCHSGILYSTKWRWFHFNSTRNLPDIVRGAQQSISYHSRSKSTPRITINWKYLFYQPHSGCFKIAHSLPTPSWTQAIPF